MKAGVRLSACKGAPTRIVAAVLLAISAYMLYRSAGALGLF